MTLVEIGHNKGLHNQCELGTDKEHCHKYLSTFYDHKFADLRDKPIKLLEIGISSGASAVLWRTYFTAATIHVVDITSPPFKFNAIDVAYVQGDAYDANSVAQLDQYDIIIDDGPHTAGSHTALIDLYYPKLKDGGLLVIEDLDYDFTELVKVITIKFGHEPTILDNRITTGWNNSQLIWITKCLSTPSLTTSS